jgi:hypothetical protein
MLGRLTEQLAEALKASKDAEENARVLGGNRFEELLTLHEKLLPAEEHLRLAQRRQAARLDEMTARRQALLERLRQLQGEAPEDASAARLRELERKIDALRREVGELRRARDKNP